MNHPDLDNRAPAGRLQATGRGRRARGARFEPANAAARRFAGAWLLILVLTSTALANVTLAYCSARSHYCSGFGFSEMLGLQRASLFRTTGAPANRDFD